MISSLSVPKKSCNGLMSYPPRQPKKKWSRFIGACFSRNPSATERELANLYLSEDKTQTPNAWKFGYGSCDEDANHVSEFRELKHFTGTRWQGGPALPDPKLNWVYHKKDESHPGASMELCSVRRWVAPKDLYHPDRGALET